MSTNHLEMQAHILSPGAMGRPSTHMYTGSCTSGLLGGVERLCGAWTPGFKALVWTENQSKESTKRPSQQQKQQSSQSTSLARLGSNVYSGPRTAPGAASQDPGRLVPCSPAVDSSASVRPRRLTRSCTEMLGIIIIYSKLPSCSHCGWEDNSQGLPRRERRVLSSRILCIDKHFITLYGAEISKVCDSKGESQFCLRLSNPMNAPLALELQNLKTQGSDCEPLDKSA